MKKLSAGEAKCGETCRIFAVRFQTRVQRLTCAARRRFTVNTFRNDTMVIEYIKDIRNYETTFIVKPGLDDAEYKAVTEKFTKMITDNGGEIINQEIWGMRKLAYEIERHSSAYYVFTEFRSTVDVNPVLEREYSFDERIIRYLTVKLDKDAAAWNDRRRAKLKGQSAA